MTATHDYPVRTVLAFPSLRRSASFSPATTFSPPQGAIRARLTDKPLSASNQLFHLRWVLFHPQPTLVGMTTPYYAADHDVACQPYTSRQPDLPPSRPPYGLPTAVEIDRFPLALSLVESISAAEYVEWTRNHKCTQTAIHTTLKQKSR